MVQKSRLLPLFVLQILPLLIFPPATLAKSLPIVGLVVLVFAGLGVALWQGRLWALSLSIFLQGLNIIVRMMILFPHVIGTNGQPDLPFIAFSLLSIVLSGVFLLRLDQPDVRSLIIV